MVIDFGLLILRVIVGGVVFAHGAQKLFGWFGGYGIKGTAGWLGSIGMQPATFWAWLAGLSEAVGGLFLLLGFLNPIGPLGIIAAMLTATIKVHWSKGLFSTNGGYELPLTNIAAAVAVALVGPGLYSLDALFGIRLPEPYVFIGGLVLVVVGVIAAVVAPARQQAHVS